MLITERVFGIFKIVNVYFADEPGTVNIPDCDVVTYDTDKNRGNINGYDRINYFTTTIDLSQDIDEIWSKINRQHRRHIRRAQKEGTNVMLSNNFEEFHRIYIKFIKTKKYTHLFGLNILPLKFMQMYGILFIAENKGEILGGNLYFHDEENALLYCHAYKLNGNTVERNKLIIDANCYLHWEAIRYFKNRNVKNYDLGGFLSDEINLNQQMCGLDYFKQSFGGKIISRYEYRIFTSYFNKLLFQTWNFLRSFTSKD